jgi:hypothetical protein
MTDLIHDRGRGPELVVMRITVQDLFPYFLDKTATEAYVCKLYELTPCVGSTPPSLRYTMVIAIEVAWPAPGGITGGRRSQEVARWTLTIPSWD